MRVGKSPRIIASSHDEMATQRMAAKFLLQSTLDRADKGVQASYVTSSTKNSEGQYECTCTLPTVCTASRSFDTQAFTGLGTSKKMAVKVAAEQAWAFVQGTDAADTSQHMQTSQDLWGAICSALTADVSSML